MYHQGQGQLGLLSTLLLRDFSPGRSVEHSPAPEGGATLLQRGSEVMGGQTQELTLAICGPAEGTGRDPGLEG